MTNDFQQAHQQSMLSHVSGLGTIDRMTDAGRFVVAVKSPAYCATTDAFIGYRYTILGHSSTRESADVMAGLLLGDPDDWDGDDTMMVFPELPRRQESWGPDDDLPF